MPHPSLADDSVLKVAFGTLPTGRNNPHDSASITRLWFYAAAYDALTFLTREGKLEPWLALSWTRQTPTTWIFVLRPGVKFSNDVPFTAQHVVDTLTYLTSAEGKIEATSIYASSIISASAIDELTIKIITTSPDPTLPRKLSLVRIAALDDATRLNHAALAERAVGTGPYYVKAWEAAGIKMDAAVRSWRPAPTQHLQGVAIPNPISRNAALESGQVDIAGAAFDPAQLNQLDKLPYKIEIDQLPAVVGLAYNTARSRPLRDVRVRQAMDLAVNKDLIIDTLFAGLAPPAAQPARREFLGFDPLLKRTPYDPVRAKQMLNEAGYADGFEVTMSLTGGATIWDQIFQAIAADLRKVGIHMSIQVVPEPVFAEYMQTGFPTDSFGTAFFSPAFDALDVMRQHSCLSRVPWYCDETIMPQLRSAMAESDLSKRETLTRNLMRHAHNTYQGMFLYESIGLNGYNPRIQNFRSDFGFLRYELMAIKGQY